MDHLTLEGAVALLRDGRVIGFPTDTVYGLAATDAGVPRIYELKSRDVNKPLVLMAAGAETLLGRAAFSAEARSLVDRYWPGPLTLVLPGAAGGTIGVRVPDHPLALELLRLSGPLWTTSANPSGQPEALTAAEVTVRLPGVDGVLDGGRAPGGRASTVVDLTGSQPVILRQGAIELDYR